MCYLEVNIWKHLLYNRYGTDTAVPKERERRVTEIFARKVTLSKKETFHVDIDGT